MREFTFLFRGRKTYGSPEEIQKHIEKWVAWFKVLGAQGLIKDPGHPLESSGKIVRGNSNIVDDGPYTDTKDAIGGYMLVEANDIIHAAELSKGCPILEVGGCVEVRPIQKINV